MVIHRVLSILFMAIILPFTQSYDILGVFPTKAVSHFRIGLALMQGLADAGHNVTMISPYHIPPIESNTTRGQIRLVYVNDQQFFVGNDQHIDNMDRNPISKAFHLLRHGIGSTRHTLHSTSVQELLASSQQFDVIIIEVFLNEALLGLGPHFNAPVIGFSPFGATKLTNDMVGSPAPVSYVPHVTLSFTDRMSLQQRMLNTLTTVGEFLFVRLIYWPAQERLYREAFGTRGPSLSTVHTNVSLVLLNTHFTLGYPRPYMNNMIEVGGLHIRRGTATQLPRTVQHFLDEATEGVIYFSMGSNIRSNEIGLDKLNALRTVFGSLPQRVLWKWANDLEPLLNVSANVLTCQWFDQEQVLAHPNVRVFITHGGLLSSMEAVYFGVPMIGIPIFGDQHLNVAKAVASGFGVLLRFENVTEQSIRWSIDELMNNKKYQRQVQLTSKQFRDRQNHPLDTAIYWAEYVARYQGAPHMHSSRRLLSFCVDQNIDVYTILVFILVIFLWTLTTVWRDVAQRLRHVKHKQS